VREDGSEIVRAVRTARLEADGQSVPADGRRIDVQRLPLRAHLLRPASQRRPDGASLSTTRLQA